MANEQTKTQKNAKGVVIEQPITKNVHSSLAMVNKLPTTQRNTTGVLIEQLEVQKHL